MENETRSRVPYGSVTGVYKIYREPLPRGRVQFARDAASPDYPGIFVSGKGFLEI